MKGTMLLFLIIVLLVSGSAKGQLNQLLSKKQTPKEYAKYAQKMISKHVALDEAQQKDVYTLYYNYATWRLRVNPSNELLKEYKDRRDDTLRSIIRNPYFVLDKDE